MLNSLEFHICSRLGIQINVYESGMNVTSLSWLKGACCVFSLAGVWRTELTLEQAALVWISVTPSHWSSKAAAM